MKKHILTILLLCSVFVPGKLFSAACCEPCCCNDSSACYSCCNQCGCDPCCCVSYDYSGCCCDEFESTVDAYGFIAKVSNEIQEGADLSIEIADGRYLHVLVPERLQKEQPKVRAKKVQDNVTVVVGDLFVITFKDGHSKSQKDGVLRVKDKDGQIVAPTQVRIKDKEGCVGTAQLCCLHGIQINVIGRRIKGVDNDAIGFVIPDELSERLSKKQIDTLFYTFVNKKFSQTVKYLEDLGIDVKSIIMAEILEN